ncbi:hypothetical protein COCVIDRAFT_40453 [Bipolaris victoriae FI3]|uniref:Uncharacterized protein n=1 Tax=Bipolaris victoriae (strain FI3) TaxID=930091 RepID=W7E0P9_BIPV3|nr:hypothetical protein COCVIDRAFT_40453 [Bipolaris victoriae FI3]
MHGVRGKCLALRLETQTRAVKPALPHRLCWTAGRLLSKKIDIVATRSRIPIQICVRYCHVHWLAEIKVSSRPTPGICPISLLLYTTNRARHLFPFEGGMHLHP